MAQTLKLRKQRKAAKEAAEDMAELTCDNCTTNTTTAATTADGAKKPMTAEERKAKKAARAAARKAKKEEMDMMRDLQVAQGAALQEEMAKGGKKTIVQEQSYGETYMKTTVLTRDSIDEQMSTDSTGERRMRVGKGAEAATAPEDAVAGTTGAQKPASTGATDGTTG